MKSVFSGSTKHGGYIGKCDANETFFVIAFFIGNHAENNETAPPRLHPVIDTLFLSIFGCSDNFSNARYASKIIMAVVTSTWDPTVDSISLLLKLFNSKHHGPVNIGSEEKVSINEMIDKIEDIAQIKLDRNYQLDKPKGVRGRNSNNDYIKEILN